MRECQGLCFPSSCAPLWSNSQFSKSVFDQLFDRIDHLICVITSSAQNDRCTTLRGKHHHSHNALSVHLQVITLKSNLTGESRRQFYDCGGRTCMQSVFVRNYNGALNHHRITASRA